MTVLVAIAILLAAVSGLAGLHPRRGAAGAAALLACSCLLGLAASVAVLCGVSGGDLAWGIPGAGFAAALALHLDPLAAAFLLPTFLVAGAVAVYGAGYLPDPSARGVRIWLGLVVAGIAGVMVAGNASTFILAWEVMALAAFLLIGTGHRNPEVRSASWLYLVATRLATLGLFAFFALLGGGGFGPLPPGLAPGPLGSALFIIALVSFGLKAGVMPLHFWLPSAHAAAPSHVSALMSGVLIKTGIYGLCRFCSWVPDPPAWWGLTILVLGASSGLLGVAFALGAHDLKKLLAYHSIENIGIILLGLGLVLLGRSLDRPEWVALGLAGALLHVCNHACFKSLLFLAAGSVVQAAGTRAIERLGGAAKVMPMTGGAFLLGAAAICGLPPLNGFVSEWLILLGFLQAGQPWALAGIAALVLIGGLALACFAKAYGTVFLGEARSHQHPTLETSRPQLVGYLAPALACLLIGLLPALLAAPLARAAGSAVPGLAMPGLAVLAPLQQVGLIGAATVCAGILLWRLLGRRAPGRGEVPTWDCGYAAPTPRMQYTASSFAAPLVDGMRHVLLPQEETPRLGGESAGLQPAPTRYRSRVPDPVLDRILAPVAWLVLWCVGRLRLAQHGYLNIYLLYVVITLIVLLAWSLR